MLISGKWKVIIRWIKLKAMLRLKLNHKFLDLVGKIDPKPQ